MATTSKEMMCARGKNTTLHHRLSNILNYLSTKFHDTTGCSMAKCQKLRKQVLQYVKWILKGIPLQRRTVLKKIVYYFLVFSFITEAKLDFKNRTQLNEIETYKAHILSLIRFDFIQLHSILN